MSKLVLRIDREIGGYAVFKSLKELGECLQEQDASASNFDTSVNYISYRLLKLFRCEKMENKKVMIVAIFAGILLLISGVSGLAIWEAIKNFVTTNIIDNYIVQIIFVVLIFIASLGGLSVIIGGLLIGRDRIRTGKLFISLGAGLGLIGLIISIIVAVMENSFMIGSFFSIGAIGLILSIIARLMVKKD